LVLTPATRVSFRRVRLETFLTRRPDADIHFIYSARSEQDIIFREELISMAQRHPNFRLDLFLDNASGGRDRHDGFLTPERLDALVKDAAERRIYLCGNQPYMDMVEDWHQSRGLAAGRLHKESFKPNAPEADPGSGSEYQFTAPQFGKTSKIRDGQTLLEIMEPNAIPIIAACRSGVCGSCKCKVVEGEVERVSTATLTTEELADGFVLACSTRAKSDLVVEMVF
jgi:NADH oxidoreductase Hcr